MPTPQGFATRDTPPRASSMEAACEIVTEFARLEELSPVWERWWRVDVQAEVFQSFAWARAWWQSFGSGIKLCTPVVHERGEPVFILPLVQRGSRVSILGIPEADYADFVCSHPRPEEPFALALHTLLRSSVAWNECALENLAAHSRILQCWPRLPADLRHWLQVRPAESCPTIILGDKRNEVLDSLTGKKHTRRRLNKLGKAGQVTFRHIETKAEAQEQLTNFFRAHLLRCALLAKTSRFEDPGMCQFVRALMEQFDLKKELRFAVVELSGQPIAWSIGFLVNGKFGYYQQTFAVDAEEYAPGEVLMYYLLDYAKLNVEREFDFMRGEEFFKRRFATDVRQSCNLYLERPGLAGEMRRLWRAAQGYGGNLVSRHEATLRAHSAFPKLRMALVWTRQTRRRWAQARKHSALAAYLLGASGTFFRTGIWSKTVTTVFRSEVGADSGTLQTEGDVTITAGRLSDLIAFTLDHAEMQLPGFSECLSRLNNAHRVHMVRKSGLVAAVAWTMDREPSAESTSGLQSRAAAPVMTLYDCWQTAGVSPGVLAKLLADLRRAAWKAGAKFLACAGSDQPALLAGLKQLGFLPEYQVASYRVFHWWRRDKIRILR